MRNVFLEQKFNIGLGYNPSLFKIVTDWGAGIPSTILGSLSYSGCVPSRRLPSICQIDPISSLEIPGTKPTQFTSVLFQPTILAEMDNMLDCLKLLLIKTMNG